MAHDTLIVVPIGNPANVDRWVYDVDRNYDILHVNYNADQHLSSEGNDNRFYRTRTIVGQKWQIIKTLLNDHMDLFEGYHYVGFWDDDLLGDALEINKAISLAKSVKAEMWQMAMTQDSDCSYDILKANSEISLSRSNFIEIMAPVYLGTHLEKIRDFLNLYEVSTGWGFDFVAPCLLNTAPVVIHSHTLKHPKRDTPSAYDKQAAMLEQQECLRAFREQHPGYPEIGHVEYYETF